MVTLPSKCSAANAERIYAVPAVAAADSNCYSSQLSSGSLPLHLPLCLTCRDKCAGIHNELRSFIMSRPKKTNDNYWRLQEQLLVSKQATAATTPAA